MMYHKLMTHTALDSIVHKLTYGLQRCLFEARKESRVFQKTSSCHNTIDASLFRDAMGIL